ncbi:mechanosensitive ion channel family protein [Myxosarcina sp. GI1(2024)]
MVKIRFLTRVIIIAIALNLVLTVPGRSQRLFLPQINWQTIRSLQNQDSVLISGCVRLDGRCIFEIFDRHANMSQLSRRIQYSEQQLRKISRVYSENDDASLRVTSQTKNNHQIINVAVGERQIPIVSVYNRDAEARGISVEQLATQIEERIQIGLERAKQERQKSFLIERAKLALGIAIITLLSGLAVFNQEKRSKKAKKKLTSQPYSLFSPLSIRLNQKQKLNLREIQHRLLQCLQIAIWLGGILLILGLFPYTRSAQLWTITLLRIPLRILIVGFLTYVSIRLSYALIAKFNRSFTENYVMNRDVRQRMQLRINTIARLVGGIITAFWVILGIVVAITIVGIDVTPLLAGAGILGLALSFASQNLIKDALNGFFIILEDQYAVGDIVSISDFGGQVENLNLRITQLRDPEGRLITIPNSEIKTVANLSSQWSRADINIPVAYQTNIDLSLKLVTKVALEMFEDRDWQTKILEVPEVLGVDDFGERGAVIRVWIKTHPFMQWEVAREFRRRIHNAFQQAGISLPIPQRQIWLEHAEADDNNNSI